MMERIVGPLHGFYLACYTVSEAEGQLRGYARISRTRPSEVWSDVRVIDKVAGDAFGDHHQAMHSVLESARQRAAMLESELPEWELLEIMEPWSERAPTPPPSQP